MAYQTNSLRICQYGSLLYLMWVVVWLTELQVSVVAKGSNYYTAAVFEHFPVEDENSTAMEELLQNLRRYSLAARTAARQEADIIVFPEWGLYSDDRHLPLAENIPDPAIKHWNPCENRRHFANRPVLRRLSCMAKRNQLYLVVNVADIQNCTPGESADSLPDNKRCPSNGTQLFNANVIFNRNGTLVAKYHKNHLYFEPGFSEPINPEPTYFETDFGLFTTFICFDISFREAVEAVEKDGVLNVAYSTYWFDHLPLMASIQFQQAFAIANRVNLLAANVHYLGSGTIGSGIYSGQKGALSYTFNPNGEAKLLISKVPTGEDFPDDFQTDAKIFRIREGDVKDVTNEEQDPQIPEQCSTKLLGNRENSSTEYRCNEMNTTDYSFVKLEQSEGSLDICRNGICCNLSYVADSMDEDFYLGIFSGIDWLYDIYGFCEESCLLVRCDWGNETCSTYPMISNTRFRSFKLSGSLNTKYVYPSVIKSKRRLASTREWEFTNNNGQVQIKYDSNLTNGDLILTAGLYGRCYDRDPPSN